MCGCLMRRWCVLSGYLNRWLIFQTLHTRYQTLPSAQVQPVQRLLFVLLDKTFLPFKNIIPAQYSE